jgi:pimeloyl-ACP methyl ester carboxylesterase
MSAHALRFAVVLVAAVALLTGCVAARQVGPPLREHRVASAEGATLHWSERGRGPVTVLLIHGWTCDSTFWDAQVDALAARYRVLTMDLAGHGFSGLPTRRWTMAEFADDVVRVADAAKARRIVLVGHSMGGPVAIEAAKRLGDRVVGVVGVDTLRTVGSGWGPEELERALAPFRADFGRAVTSFVDASFLSPATTEALARRIRTTMGSARPEMGIPAIVALNDWYLRADFAGYSAPLVLLNAAQPPTAMAPLLARVPGARVRTFDGVGHFLMMETPQPFNVALLEELARLAQPSRS